MSELIAEARVLVTPDTTTFRSLLTAQVTAASKGVSVSVPVTPVVAPGAATTRSVEQQIAQQVAGAKAAESEIARSRANIEATARAATATASTQRIAQREAEVAAILRQERDLSIQEQKFEAERVTAATKASDLRIAAKEREVAALLAADRTSAESGAASAAASNARALGGVSRGAGSAILNLVGLRGATLASTGPFLAGAAAAIAFGKSLSVFADFQGSLNTLKVVAGATSDEMARVSETAKQLGADITLPGVSAVDAAEAMTELSKAGLSVQQSIDGARGVLELATAAGIDNAAATELAASALNAFGLAGDQAVHVADVLANAANAAQGSISDIGLALSQSATAGRQAGLSLEQTTAILTAFARAGLKGSDAGTSLRVLLLRLINPSKQASEVIAKLGLHLRDATGNINLGFFDEFRRKTESLTKAERDRAAAQIGGQDAFRGIAILARLNIEQLQALVDNANRSGTALEVSSAKAQGLAGSMENLKNQVSNAALEIGGSLAPTVQGVVDIFSKAVQGTVDLIGGIQDLRNEALKPIDIIVNFIPSGAGGGEGGVLDDLKSLATGSILSVVNVGLKNLSEIEKEAAKHTADFNAAIAANQLPRLVSDLNKAGASSSALNDVVKQLLEMQKGIQGGTEKFEPFRKNLAAFIAELQALSQQPDITVPIKLPEDLFGTVFISGLTVKAKTAASSLAETFKLNFLPPFNAAGVQAAEEISKGLLDPGAQGAIKAAAQTSAANALAAAQSGLDLALAQAGGNEGQTLSVLRQRESRQQTFLDAVLGRPQDEQKNVDLATKEANLLAGTRAAIKSILDGRKAAAKQASDAADATKKANEDAAAKTKAANDAAFLTAQEDARGRQQRLVGLAGDTEGLADDIRRQQQLRVLITNQINAIRNSALAEDAKRTAIKALAKSRQATTDTINQLAATDRQQRAAQRQQAAEALASAKLDLAQTTFDLTGQKAPLERALDAEIKRQIAIKNGAKKASLDFINAQIAIRRLLKQKKDLNDEVKDAAQDVTGGTTLVDLFNENQRIFDQIGNVGQSAAGLTTHAQNASISAIVQHKLEFGGSPAATAQQRATDALTRAIVELTNKLGGQGNFSLGVPAPGTGPVISRSQALAEEQRFFYQKQAKAMVEQGLG